MASRYFFAAGFLATGVISTTTAQIVVHQGAAHQLNGFLVCMHFLGMVSCVPWPVQRLHLNCTSEAEELAEVRSRCDFRRLLQGCRHCFSQRVANSGTSTAKLMP